MNKADEKEKFKDWEYALKSAIYLSLIGYADSNHHSIPCKVRGQMEDSILKKFKASLEEKNFSEPLPPVVSDGPVKSKEAILHPRVCIWSNGSFVTKELALKAMEEYAAQFKPPFVSDEDMEKAAEKEYPLDDPRKNMFHDNYNQYARRDAFKAGVKWLQSLSKEQGI